MSRGSGYTITPDPLLKLRMSRSRNWCWTINNYTEADELCLNELEPNAKYLVFGRETGEDGTPHLQGFVIFKNDKTLKQLSKFLPRAHIEKAKGTPTQAADYCKKDGDFYEHGTPPVSKQRQGEMEKERYKRAWDIAKSGGDVEEIDPDILLRHYGTIKRIRADYQQVPESIADLDFWWYHGASGTGKSLTARSENPGYYIKNKNKWWDGYIDQPCVIIEEWFPEVVSGLQQMLKEWCDHHPFAAETKGSTTSLRPPKIIVTSNYSLEECFGHDRTGLFEPLSRRFKIRTF